MGMLAARVKTLAITALAFTVLGAFGYDTSSYVQEGLVAQWDGIDNAGLGFHDLGANTWKDLKGIYDLPLASKGSWGSNCLQVADGCAANYGAKGLTDYLTIEVLYRQPTATSKYGFLFDSGDKYHYVLIKEDGKTLFFNGSGGLDDIVTYDTLDGEIHAVSAVYSSSTAVAAVYTNGVTATGATGSASYNAGSGWLMLGDRAVGTTYPWSGEIYAIRLYAAALTAEQIATNYLVDAVRYLGATPDDVLSICASPFNLDVTLTPGYAGRDGLVAGESVALSAPSGEVTVADGFKATCTGWKLYDAAGSVVDSGSETSFTYVHPTPAAYRQLEWQFSTSIRVAASGAGGTYSPAEQWVPFGASASFLVSPDEGKCLYAVTNDFSAETWTTTDVTIANVRAPINCFATYRNAYYVKPDGDDANDGTTRATARQTIAAAVALTSPTVDGDTVVVMDGVYTNTAQITLDKPCRVIGEHGPDNARIFSKAAARVFYLDNTKSLLEGVTVYSDATTSIGGNAAIYVNYGVVDGCVVSNFLSTHSPVYIKNAGSAVKNTLVCRNATSGRTQSGIELNGSGTLAENCRIIGNTGNNDTYGCGLYLWGGSLARNCLVACNTNKSSNVAGAFVNSGTLENCTVVDNVILNGGVKAGVHLGSGAVRNCLVHGNRNTAGIIEWSGTESGYTYNCMTPAPSGAGNVLAIAPDFFDRAAMDFRLKSGNTIDAGLDQSWMVAATDLAGNPRLLGGAVDMGCFEYQPAALAASVIPSFASAFGPQGVTLTAFASGTNLVGLAFSWTVKNELGETVYSGTGPEPSVTQPFGYGRYSVFLDVSNTAGETASWSGPDTFAILGETVYVARETEPVFPYINKNNAANDINTALAACMDGSTIVVCDGTYTNTDTISIAKAITVRSENGAADTTLYTESAICLFTLNHQQARVQGFTLASDHGSRSMRVAYLVSGTLADCDIHDFYGTQSLLLLSDASAMITNCHIHANETSGRVNCVHLDPGGIVMNCRIVGNTGNNNTYGAALYAYGGTCTFRNNLVACNTNKSSSVSAVYANSSTTMDNCTIVGNRINNSASKAAVVAKSGSKIRNCIIHDNANTGGICNWEETAAAFSHCCTAPVPVADAGNFEPVEPMFADADYRLPSGICVDTGTNQTWMAGALDLDGTDRIIHAVVDVGCYEYVPGALECSAVPSATSVIGAQDITLTAIVSGSNLTGLKYTWVVTNQLGETVVSVTQSPSDSLTRSFPLGVYSVYLKVENGVGDYDEFEQDLLFQVKPSVILVATDSIPAFPYSERTTAFTNVVAALDFAESGMRVVVTDGVYTNASNPSITQDIIIESEHGYQRTRIFSANSGSAWTLNAAGAVLRGLTLFSDRVSRSGRALDILQGTVDGCVITNFNSYYQDGLIVFRSGAGVLTNCLVTHCTSTFRTYFVKFSSGGTAVNCRFVDNISDTQSTAYGSLFHLAHAGAVVRGCLVAGNEIKSQPPDASVVFIESGSVDNCTLADNRATVQSTVAAVKATGGTVRNCIIWNNTNISGVNDWTGTASCFSHCCVSTAGLPPEDGNLASDPLFTTRKAEPAYSLFYDSPCRDQAEPLAWMTADSLDLAGNPRVLYGLPDIGCYECRRPRGTTFILR